MVRLSSRFRWDRICNPSRRPQPRGEPRFGLCPRSLAATDGIDVSFYSCGYLDVSVPRVRSNPPMHSAGGDRLLRPARFPDSEIHGSTPGCRLPVAYRRLQRPSSPLDAKTSTVHPCELDHADRAAADEPGHPAAPRNTNRVTGEAARRPTTGRREPTHDRRSHAGPSAPDTRLPGEATAFAQSPPLAEKVRSATPHESPGRAERPTTGR